MFITSTTSIRAFLALALIASASASPLPAPAPAPQDPLALLSTLGGGGDIDTSNGGGLGLGGLNDALNLGSLDLLSSPSSLESSSSSSFALSSDADTDSTPHGASLNGIPLALGSTGATSASSSPNTNLGVTDLRHPSESSSESSPLDLAALPILGALAPTTLLGRRAVYASASGQGASDAPVIVGRTVPAPAPVPAPVALGRAERFRARMMRRASLAVA